MTEAGQAQQIWETALHELQTQVNRSNYRTWLAKTSGLSYQDNEFVIGVANTFVAEYLDKNQRSLIEKVLTNITQQSIQVQFQVNGHEHYPPFKKSSRSKAVPIQQSSLPLFSRDYTFDSFVVGSSNQIAYAAALAVAKSPGLYNPLFIQGGTGLGKTHLLHAIGQVALSNNLLIEYVRAEQYTNQLISSLRDNTIDDFRNKYRSVDMLLIDDIQFFSGKEKTEENFFYTFDELHSSNRQIVLTSDRSPRTILFLQERLRSRFEGGLVTDIQTPDFETRLAILQAKAEKKRIDVPSDVLELIATRVQQNIRALEGSLNRIIAYARPIGARLTLEVAEQALAGTPPKANHITASLVIEAVLNSFHLKPADIKSKKRDEAVALARQLAMYLIRQETNCSLAEAGHLLGDRTPATVSHGYQKIASQINDNPSLRQKVFEIQQEIHASL